MYNPGTTLSAEQITAPGPRCALQLFRVNRSVFARLSDQVLCMSHDLLGVDVQLWFIGTKYAAFWEIVLRLVAI